MGTPASPALLRTQWRGSHSPRSGRSRGSGIGIRYMAANLELYHSLRVCLVHFPPTLYLTGSQTMDTNLYIALVYFPLEQAFFAINGKKIDLFIFRNCNSSSGNKVAQLDWLLLNARRYKASWKTTGISVYMAVTKAMTVSFTLQKRMRACVTLMRSMRLPCAIHVNESRRYRACM